MKRLISILGVLMAIVSLVSLVDGILDSGVTPLLSGMVEFYRYVTATITRYLNLVISAIPSGAEFIVIPDGYVEALIISFFISNGYAQALSSMERNGTLEAFPARRVMAPFVVLILSFTLVGISLLITLARNSLRNKTEAEIALQTFYHIGLGLLAISLFGLINFGATALQL